MRIISTIVICALAAFSMSARDTKLRGKVGRDAKVKPTEQADSSNPKPHNPSDFYWVSKGSGFWGLQFGADLYCADIYNFSSGTLFDSLGWGGFGGLSYKYQWRSGAVIESGMLFSYDFAPVGVKYIDQSTGSVVRSVFDLNRGVIQVPLRAGCRFGFWENFGFTITAGIQGSLGIFGSFEQEGIKAREYKIYGADGVWHRLGLSGSLALTLELDGPVSLSLLGSTSILNMSKRDIYDRSRMHDVSLSLGLTYFFNRRHDK
ncbi:MAG: hypothetical protein K2M87_01810 [Muribaculaceae bacterium]|nr:hypothetical protein [Muribaculaceae bacterium]